MPLKRTPLYETHIRLGAKMVPFAGYEMPVFYPTGIIKEHLATREAAGLFDISHMCMFILHGKHGLDYIQFVASNDASKLEQFTGQYSVLLNTNGGTIDDVFIFRLLHDFVLIVNAGNADKVAAHLNQQLFDKKAQDINFDCEIINRHDTHSILSLQGPQAKVITAKLFAGSDLTKVKRNNCFESKIDLGGSLNNFHVFVSRTGYAGGDGFEFYYENSGSEIFWNKILEYGKPLGLVPVGLGARDSLRLEAGLPLYGHEYDENTSPIESGYPWAVKFSKPSFIGREALVSIPPKKKLVGLLLETGLIARQGFEVYSDNSFDGSAGQSVRLGTVTSGSQSPILKQSIATAYLNLPESTRNNYTPEAFSRMFEVGTPVMVKIRDQLVKAKVVALPFVRLLS